MATSKNLNDMAPFRATHPGFVVEEELDYMGVGAKEFAEMAGLNPAELDALMKGELPLTEDTAQRIAQHTELKADVLMKLQTKYEADVERIALRDAETTTGESGKDNISIPIPTETYRLVSIAAKKQGTTISEFIKNALDKAVVLL